MKTMAKILTLILALVLAFSFTAMTAAAEGETANPNVAKFTSKLSVTGSKNPNVTFEYTITGGSCISDTGDTSGYTELKDGYTELVTIGTAAFTESDAETKQVEVDLSGTKFNVPGIYRYTITQTDPKVAGVTPDAKSVIYLDVYVTIEGSEGTQTLSFVFNTKESGAVNNTEEDRVYKVEGFENSFTSYSLSASKTVTGNQGDVNKYFKFTVKSALPEGYTYPYAAAYTVDISNADQNYRHDKPGERNCRRTQDGRGLLPHERPVDRDHRPAQGRDLRGQRGQRGLHPGPRGSRIRNS